MREGGLLSASPSWDEARQSAFGIVAQVLRGANPATIPVRTSTRYVIAINLRTARAMGLAVPPSVLLRADVVVE